MLQYAISPDAPQSTSASSDTDGHGISNNLHHFPTVFLSSVYIVLPRVSFVGLGAVSLTMAQHNVQSCPSVGADIIKLPVLLFFLKHQTFCLYAVCILIA